MARDALRDLRRKLSVWAVLRLSPRHHRRMRQRGEIAERYLSGEGIEIGALHIPLRTPPGVRVRYVDYWPVTQQRERYDELGWVELVPVDIIDDGQVLRTLPDESFDFVVANHVIEHCEDPLGTLEAWLRVLRPGGVVYVGVPDKRYTFDRHRAETAVDHVVEDYRRGPESSRRAHWEELARTVYGVPGPEVGRFVEARMDASGAAELVERQQPHYHAWTPRGFRAVLERARTELGQPYRVEEIRELDAEFVAILRKTSEHRAV